MSDKRIWSCKIGLADESRLFNGADSPMRQAVKKAFRELTHTEPDFIFSGWGDELTEDERTAVYGQDVDD